MCCISCQNSTLVKGGCCHVDCKTVRAQLREEGRGGASHQFYYDDTDEFEVFNVQQYSDQTAFFFVFKDESQSNSITEQ